MRTARLVSSATDVAPGDHICWTYESDEEYHRGLAAYLAAGGDAGDKLLCFAHDAAIAPVLAELERVAPGQAQEWLACGRLTFADPEAAYTPDGRFDEGRMLEAFRSSATAAVDEGYRALRAGGETAWLFGDVDGGRLAAYEAACDRLVTGLPLIGLCTYDARGQDAAALAEIHAVHGLSHGSSATTPGFRVFARPDGGVAVAGEADAFDVEAFTRTMLRALAVADRPVLDVSGVAFIDVAALRAFAYLLGRQQLARPVEVAGMRPLVRRCWTLLRLGELAPHVQVA